MCCCVAASLLGASAADRISYTLPNPHDGTADSPPAAFEAAQVGAAGSAAPGDEHLDDSGDGKDRKKRSKRSTARARQHAAGKKASWLELATQGMELFNAGDMDGCIESLRAAIQRGGRKINHGVYNNLGIALVQVLSTPAHLPLQPFQSQRAEPPRAGLCRSARRSRHGRSSRTRSSSGLTSATPTQTSPCWRPSKVRSQPARSQLHSPLRSAVSAVSDPRGRVRVLLSELLPPPRQATSSGRASTCTTGLPSSRPTQWFGTASGRSAPTPG